MKNYEINLDLDGTPVELIPSALKVQGYDLKTVLVSWKRIRPGELIPLISVEKNPVSNNGMTPLDLADGRSHSYEYRLILRQSLKNGGSKLFFQHFQQYILTFFDACIL